MSSHVSTLCERVSVFSAREIAQIEQITQRQDTASLPDTDARHLRRRVVRAVLSGRCRVAACRRLKCCALRCRECRTGVAHRAHVEGQLWLTR